MITAGDFRNGVTFEMDGGVYQVVEFQHVKPGKGAAFVRTKYKNVITGAVVETSFNPTAKFPTAYIERKEMEYSYSDGDLYYFMDQETFELVPIGKSELGEHFKFVKENMSAAFFPIRARFSALSLPHSLSFRLPQPSRASEAIPPPTLPSPPPSKPVPRSAYPSSSTRAI